MALQGTKALERWCQVVTEGYKGVRILNMSTSWRSGLGFCAIIHHFRPELIDFDSLDPDDVYGNNELAFSVAEQQLGIPALLDAQDMVECELIDRLSILTYLSQFYQAFHDKRTGQTSSSKHSSPIRALARPGTAMPSVIGGGRRNSEPCKVCGNAVFILERLNVGGKLLHRTCFKCARCRAQLSIANYYETEKGDYCCDVCPDEEANQAQVIQANKQIVVIDDVTTTANDVTAANKCDVTESSSSSEEEDDDDGEEDSDSDHGGEDSKLGNKNDDNVNEAMEKLVITEKDAATKDDDEVVATSTKEEDGAADDSNNNDKVDNDVENNNDAEAVGGDTADNEAKTNGETNGAEIRRQEETQEDSNELSNCEQQSISNVNSDRHHQPSAIDDDSNHAHRSQADASLAENSQAEASQADANQAGASQPDTVIIPTQDAVTDIAADATSVSVPADSKADEPSTTDAANEDAQQAGESDKQTEADHNEIAPISNLIEKQDKDDVEVVKSVGEGSSTEQQHTGDKIDDRVEEDNIEKEVVAAEDDNDKVESGKVDESCDEKRNEDDRLQQEAVVKAKHSISYPDDMNPFGDDDDEDEEEKEEVVQKVSKDEREGSCLAVQETTTTTEKVTNETEESVEKSEQNKKEASAKNKPVSTNPFGSDFEDSDDNGDVTAPVSSSTPMTSSTCSNLQGPPKPPRISLNPFGSDFEDDEPHDVKLSTIKKCPNSPALSTGSSSAKQRSRKKRPAPKPPSGASPLYLGGTSTPPPTASPRRSINNSPVPAPRNSNLQRPSKPPPPPRPPPRPPSADVSKSCKDRDNLNRRSQAFIMETSSLSDASSVLSMSTTTSASTSVAAPPPPPPPPSQRAPTEQKVSTGAATAFTPMSPNKSEGGQWKKKKGPAPPRPTPAKRQVKKLPRKAVNQELHDNEVKQSELERQGVKLEKMIREVTVRHDAERAAAAEGVGSGGGGGSQDGGENVRDSLGPEAEDLIIQLFELVNLKNELFRRQTVLMYMKREHRLEEEHADIEHQIRILMAKPEALRSEDDKGREDQLIERLMAIVSQRNEIVDCMEMDRVRALEEDESIEIHMEEYAAVKPPETDASAKKKKKKKEKKKKKKNKGYDADKDIDTKECPNDNAAAGSSASATSSPSKSSSALSPLKKRLTLVSPLSGGGASGSALSDKEKAKKLRKKILRTLKPSSKNKNANV